MTLPLRITCSCVAVAALLCGLGCGDDSPSEPIATENAVVVTRADQSKVVFANGSQLSVWCGPWESGLIPRQALHVILAGTSASPGWQLRAVVADVKIGVPLTFPNEFIFDNPKNVDIFVADPPNELSTNRPQSGGSITFQKLNCAAGGEVKFSIAATVASEFGGGPSVTVSGTFSAPIGQAPAGF